MPLREAEAYYGTFQNRREYMSQVIHYTNKQCKLLRHTNIDINIYGD